MKPDRLRAVKLAMAKYASPKKPPPKKAGKK